MTWALLHDIFIGTIQDLDEALGEWQLDEEVTVHRFATTISAVEFAFPPARQNLFTARSILVGLQRRHRTRHHFPLCFQMMLVFMGFFGAWRGGRAAGGLFVQYIRVLRPSEVLNIFPEDVSLPEDSIDPHEGICIVSLGVRINTKNNRPQFIVLHE